MDGNGLLVLGAASAAGGVALLRLSWARRKRSHHLNLTGWSLLLLALVSGWNGAGAWGASVEALVAMMTAFLCLGWAGWTSPPGATKASNRRVGMLPEGGAPLRLGRRLITFVMVGVLAMLASLGLALGTRLLALLSGAGEADANVVAIFATPLAWALIAYALVMTSDRRRQFAILALSSLAAIPAFLQGTHP